MGFFDFLNSKPSVEKLTKKLVSFVYDSVQTEKGVRVEDALCVMSTILAERCIKIANEFSIDKHNFEPGSAIFSEKVNEILIGPIAVESWNDLPEYSVFAKIKRKIDSHFTKKPFPKLIRILETYAKNVRASEWGNIGLSVPNENKPSILPLQAGYETRKYVDDNINLESDEKTLRIVINAICRILIDTKMVLDSSVALTLVFELINRMSKTATMTDEKMKELQAEMEK